MGAPSLHLFQIERDGVDIFRMLTREYVEAQAQQNTDVVLLPDANILVNVRNFFRRGHSFKALGLHKLQRLIKELKHVHVVPGFALRELPSGLRLDSEIAFDRFLQDFCGLQSHPLATRGGFEGEEMTMRPLHAQSLAEHHPDLALHYYFLTKIHEILTRDWLSEGAARFRCFIDEVVQEVNMLSGLDVELARYCFFDRNSKCLRGKGVQTSTARTLKLIQLNFLGTFAERRKFGQLMKVIDNATWDLTFLQNARRVAAYPFAGRKQDVWIATFDSKLWEFGCTICEKTAGGIVSHWPELEAAPEIVLAMEGKLVEIGIPSGLQNFEYWQKTMDYRISVQSQRWNVDFEKQAEHLPELAEKLAKKNIETIRLRLAR